VSLASHPDVKIQSASWRDFSAFVALERVCFEKDPWPWTDVLAALTFPETVRLKAVVDGRIVGFAVGDRRRGEKAGWIASIGVHPDHRRQGLGSRLLAACEAELGLERVRLTLRASNRDARALYDKSGYYAIDVWRRYYHDGEDGVVMEKKMAPASADR
jgi:ribosomal protein S18 acetylase RimI-like enzyme